MTPPKLSSLKTTDKIRLAAELDGFKYVKVVGEPEPCHWQLSNKYDKDGTLSAGTPWSVSYVVRNTPDDGDSIIDLRLVPDYSTSYDAIIPLIQKLCRDPLVRKKLADYLIYNLDSIIPDSLYGETPSQLLDALLVATGKATI